MPSAVEIAWAAGMIDGDGCITLQRCTGMRKPLLVVDNTDPEILDELLRLFGGALTMKRRYKEHHRQAWSWRLTGSRQIRAVLVAVYPHMRCSMKKERARMLLEEWDQITPRNGHYTDATRQAKIEWEGRFLALGAGRGSRAIP